MQRQIAQVFKAESGRVLSGLIRVLGDFQLAEDAVQDAFVRASETWPRDGIPQNPAAWITTVARNTALNRSNRERNGPLRAKEELPEVAAPETPPQLPDDQLRLIFTCCHPAISGPNQIALTLRTLRGLSTAEIARAFLSDEVAMAQRLVRAKKKIREAKIPYEVPSAEDLPVRLEAVLSVIYLVFNEGYASAFSDELVRTELCADAIGLARLLNLLLPDEAEAMGLLSLMLLHDARRDTRTDANGDLVVLEEQDRNRWHQAAIAEGTQLLDRAMALRVPGPYQIKAAISALHCAAKTAAETDWKQIAALYGSLMRFEPTPVVELNLAAATGMADGPDAGLKLLEQLSADPELAGYHLLPAARADLLRRAGRRDEAAAAYREALVQVTNPSERRYLEKRLAAL